jgi:Fe-S cluster assembly iron-binding protein IscA
MITVTEQAKEALKTILFTTGADPDEGLRLMPTPEGGCVLLPSTLLHGDEVVEYKGYKVLIIGIEYFHIVDGKIVDYRDTENGPLLLLR